MSLTSLISTILLSLSLQFNPSLPDPRLGQITDFLNPKIVAAECQNNLETEVQPQEIYLVSRISDKDPADQEPKFAKVGEKVNIYLVLKAENNGQDVYYTEAKNIKIGNKNIPENQIRAWSDSYLKPEIEWFKVEPLEKSYSYINGHNLIEYTELFFDLGWTVKADVHPILSQDQFSELESGLGVMRYKATFQLGNQKFSTPGKESKKSGGISPDVLRVSFRPETGSWTDHLFGLFNTPYIWGSVASQIDGQIGSDCADFALYGWRRAGHNDLDYTWSEGLKSGRYTQPAAFISSDYDERIIRDESGQEISYSQVQEGDLVFYPGHIGVLYKDNGNKKLDCEDLVLHVLGDTPKREKMCDAYGTPIEIRRWNDSKK